MAAAGDDTLVMTHRSSEGLTLLDCSEMSVVGWRGAQHVFSDDCCNAVKQVHGSTWLRWFLIVHDEPVMAGNTAANLTFNGLHHSIHCQILIGNLYALRMYYSYSLSPPSPSACTQNKLNELLE